MTTKSKKGFTIIEVVLVLAIAGLIFLMVFIALPALQRAQRNTQRQNDMSRFAAAMTTYQTNNGGTVPTGDNWQTFPMRYMDSNCKKSTSTSSSQPYVFSNCGSKFKDPDGGIYKLFYLYGGVKTRVDAGKTTGLYDKEVKAYYTTENNHTIVVLYYSGCSTTERNIVYKEGQPRKYSIHYRMEGGSVYCVDNG